MQGFLESHSKADELKFRISLSSGLLRFDDIDSDRRSEITSNGESISDAWKNQDLFLRETYFRYRPIELPWFWLQIGKQCFIVGNSLVLDHYEWGLKLKGDWDFLYDFPLKLNFDLVAIQRESPFFHLQLTGTFSKAHEVNAFGAYFIDRSNSFSEILRSSASQSLVSRILEQFIDLETLTDTSRLSWIGLSGKHQFSKVDVEWTTAMELGDVTLHVTPTRDFHFNTRGFLFDTNVTIFLEKQFSLMPFLHFSSGEDRPSQEVRDGTVESFISLFPLIDRTNIFFGSGPDQDISSRSISFSGVDARGVLTPGISVFWQPSQFYLKGTIATLWAPSGETGKKHYGWEANLDFVFRFNRYLDFIAEGNFFVPGSFFDNSASLASSFIIGVDIKI